MEKYIGKSVYKGTAIGPINVLKKSDGIVKRQHVEDVAAELQRLEDAKKQAQAQLGALGLQLVERGHAEALDVGHADAARVLSIVQEPVLGDGAGERLLGHLVGHAVLVGVVGVLRSLADVGVDHVLFDKAVAERHAVVAEQLLVLDDRPFAVVDAAVADALDRRLPQDDDLGAALVGRDERRPHALSAVAHHDDVRLVVPRLRHPVARGGRSARRAARERGGAGHGGTGNSGTLQKVAT